MGGYNGVQKETKGTEIVTWVAVAVLFLWCFRLTKMIGDYEKRQESMTTQILNVVVALGKRVGMDIRVSVEQ